MQIEIRLLSGNKVYTVIIEIQLLTYFYQIPYTCEPTTTLGELKLFAQEIERQSADRTFFIFEWKYLYVFYPQTLFKILILL